MNIEELKDAIRDTFSDQGQDSFYFAVKRFWFLITELGHAWVNLPKEFMTDKLGYSERIADVLKYLVAYLPVVLLGLIVL